MIPLRQVTFFLSCLLIIKPTASCSDSETDCADGEYCRNTGSAQECFSCSVCIEQWIVDSFPTKNCATLCPEAQGPTVAPSGKGPSVTPSEAPSDVGHQCDTHEDCGVGTGQWCSKNHRCHECDNGACFYSDAFEIDENECIGSDYCGNFSIDLACPEACCDWVRSGGKIGRRSAYDLPNKEIVVGQCNVNLDIDAYFVEEMKPDITATQLKKDGTSCEVRKTNFSTASSFTSSVTTLDCLLSGEACEDWDVTLGLILVSDRDDQLLEKVEFFNAPFDDDDYFFAGENPVAKTAIPGYETEYGGDCIFETITEFVRVMMILILVLVASCIFVPLSVCLYRCYARRQREAKAAKAHRENNTVTTTPGPTYDA